MKQVIFSIMLVLGVFPVFAQNVCLDIHLKDGQIIKGVKAKFEELYDVKYVVYWYGENSDSVKRIDARLISHFEDAECDTNHPLPTRTPIRDGSSRGNLQAGDIWNQMFENLRDANEIRRKDVWERQLKGRYVKLCGTLERVTADKKHPSLEISSSDPVNIEDRPIRLVAYIRPGETGKISQYNIGDMVCVTGKIVNTAREMNNSEMNLLELLDLGYLMNLNVAVADYILESCNVEKGKPQEKKPDTSLDPRDKKIPV